MRVQRICVAGLIGRLNAILKNPSESSSGGMKKIKKLPSVAGTDWQTNSKQSPVDFKVSVLYSQISCANIAHTDNPVGRIKKFRRKSDFVFKKYACLRNIKVYV